MQSEKTSYISNILSKLKNTYRLVVLRDDTLEEVTTYKLTKLNIYILSTGIFTLIVLIVVLLIMFTPIKHSIPGYGNLTTKNEVEVLKQKVRKMESDIVSKDDYISAIRKIILGEKDITNYELVKDDVADNTLNEEPTEEEYQLRMDVEKKEKFSITNKNSIYSSKNLRPPLRGTISSKFDIKKDHFGIDVVAAKGTAIEAVSDGTVIMSEYSIKTGHTLVLMHENNLVTCYKHNSILLKKIGNLVKAGEAIAIIGNTGEMTDGPHLHFEMWLDGKPIDPATLINF